MRRGEQGPPSIYVIDAEAFFRDGAGVDLTVYPGNLHRLQAGRGTELFQDGADGRRKYFYAAVPVFELLHRCEGGPYIVGRGVEEAALDLEIADCPILVHVPQHAVGLKLQHRGAAVFRPDEFLVEAVIGQAGGLAREGHDAPDFPGGIDADEFSGLVQSSVDGIEAFVRGGKGDVAVVKAPLLHHVLPFHEGGAQAVGRRPFLLEIALYILEDTREGLAHGLVYRQPQGVPGQGFPIDIVVVAIAEEGVVEGRTHTGHQQISGPVIVRGITPLRAPAPLPEIPVEAVGEGDVVVFQEVGGAPAARIREGRLRHHRIPFQQGRAGIDGRGQAGGQFAYHISQGTE